MSGEASIGNAAAKELSPARRQWVLDCGRRYWANTAAPIAALPITAVALDESDLRAQMVVLPDWARDIGIDGRVLVEKTAIAPGEGPEWQRCDWLGAAWLHLTAAVERRQEAASGPIQSYSILLRDREERRYQRAWVNRIFLFLRRWAGHEAGVDSDRLFGPLPEAEIIMTHDVDAVRKTPEIRVKQGAFFGFNAVRALVRADFKRAIDLGARSMRFITKAEKFWTFEKVRALEEAAGLRSILHFYGGPPGFSRRSPSRILLDPGYDIGSSELRGVLKSFRDGGWTIGLHQSTAAWRDAMQMQYERGRLESCSAGPVLACRQHWLRFSWATTWRAQEAAGLRSDSTLGFNDRPGFRNGAALRMHPWNFDTEGAMTLESLPMVFMDSHFYDYAEPTSTDVEDRMSYWIDEIRAVRGQATVNWHTHTITDAYGWGGGFTALLHLLSR